MIRQSVSAVLITTLLWFSKDEMWKKIWLSASSWVQNKDLSSVLTTLSNIEELWLFDQAGTRNSTNDVLKLKLWRAVSQFLVAFELHQQYDNLYLLRSSFVFHSLWLMVLSTYEKQNESLFHPVVKFSSYFAMPPKLAGRFLWRWRKNAVSMIWTSI